jgi:hypothetical protein
MAFKMATSVPLLTCVLPVYIESTRWFTHRSPSQHKVAHGHNLWLMEVYTHRNSLLRSTMSSDMHPHCLFTSILSLTCIPIASSHPYCLWHESPLPHHFPIDSDMHPHCLFTSILSLTCIPIASSHPYCLWHASPLPPHIHIASDMHPYCLLIFAFPSHIQPHCPPYLCLSFHVYLHYQRL